MAIDIQEFTNADISVSPTGVAGGNFGILGFLTNEQGVISVPQRTRSYTSIASVGDDWAATSEVYKAASAFYAQTPAPRDFTVIVCFETDQAATLVGGGSGSIEELVAITDGDLSITVGTADFDLTGLDFSSALNFDDVATLITTALTSAAAPATCTHNGLQFVITTDVVGVTAAISYGTSPLDGTTSDLLGLSQHQAVAANGIAAEKPVEALTKAVSLGKEFIGLVCHKKYRDIPAATDGSSTDEIAVWAEANKKIFCNTTNDLTVLSSVITTDIASRLKALTLRYTLTTFAKNVSQYPSASVFGRAASVNFESIGSTLTLNLKQMPTITVEDLSPNEFAVLRSKNASAVVQIGKTVNAYTDSRMASGSWLDTTHGLMWLENRIETDMFNLLYQTNTKIPYTQAGINTTVGVLDRSLQAAVRNGLAGPGFLPDGTYLPEGYIIESVPLGQVTSGDKGNRIYQGLSFKMVGAGALHEVYIAGQFSE